MACDPAISSVGKLLIVREQAKDENERGSQRELLSQGQDPLTSGVDLPVGSDEMGTHPEIVFAEMGKVEGSGVAIEGQERDSATPIQDLPQSLHAVAEAAVGVPVETTSDRESCAHWLGGTYPSGGLAVSLKRN